MSEDGIMINNFDLTNWTCFSERRNSKSYMSADKKWMVKFGTEFAEMTEESLQKEMEITKKALSIGVKTPKVDDIVKLPDGSLGLIYEYVEGKKSIARAASEDLDNIDYYMKRFAHIAKDLHSKICDVNKFESMEERTRKQVKKWDILNDRQKDAALKLIDEIPKTNTCLHGDFQSGNFIITSTDEFAIDLSGIGYGNPDYDIACLYFFYHYFPSSVTDRLFHCEPKYLLIMWDSFVKHYFDTNDTKVVEELSNKYAKYALVCFFQQFEVITPDKIINQVVDEYFDKLFGL